MILDKDISKLTGNDLKQGISEKFGSVKRFCWISGRQENDVSNVLRRTRKSFELESQKLSIYLDARLNDAAPVEGVDLTPGLRLRIRDAIYFSYTSFDSFRNKHTIKEFCVNTIYNQPWISRVINVGIHAVGKITPKVKLLIAYLNVKQ